ncbi:MAG: ABC transporter substrate-binding protein [Piscirickettsiaceae bacterium]|nr:ABC transporter substrate-binding protein [Piscirickettsiaceae bacterium]
MLAKQVMTKMITALLMLFMVAANVQADDVVEPQALMEATTNQMLQALKDNKEALEEDSSLIYGLVQDIIMPDFDFNKMSKLALGKNWRKADSEQRERFTAEFQLLLVRTYSTAMLEYTDEEIKFLPFRGDLSKKKVKVAMEILQSGGPSIPMALSMYLNKENAWKVYDVKIDGISLVTNYRSSFSTKIRNGGMDKLIDNLAKRNEKVKKANKV